MPNMILSTDPRESIDTQASEMIEHGPTMAENDLIGNMSPLEYADLHVLLAKSPDGVLKQFLRGVAIRLLTSEAQEDMLATLRRPNGDEFGDDDEIALMHKEDALRAAEPMHYAGLYRGLDRMLP